MTEKPKNKHAQALSKLGASKGGFARAKVLTKAQLSEIGKNAVTARWEKYRALRGISRDTAQAARMLLDKTVTPNDLRRLKG